MWLNSAVLSHPVKQTSRATISCYARPHCRVTLMVMRSRDPACAPRRSGGFSLIELLIAIGIVALLLTLLTSIIIHVREQAQRVKCANNLRQVAVALQAYANTNRGRLPQHAYTGRSGFTFAYDVPRLTADALVAYTGKYSTLFCPAGDAEYDPRGIDWQWESTPGGTCITGYHWLFARATNNPPPLDPPKQYHKTLRPTDPAHAEVAADAVIAFKGRFTGLHPEHYAKNLSRTNHLRRDTPTGGNILFLDGHVIWRPFDQMTLRGGPNDLWF
jgi:prepilin-type N-terminal cleavage/methylation domain-containing protein/prepilin-type processing-associated H-X9-DG protein